MKTLKAYIMTQPIIDNIKRKQIIEHIIQFFDGIFQNIQEDEASDLKANIIKNLDRLDIDRLRTIYQSISGPLLRKVCRELFSLRGMRDSKAEVAADQLYQKLIDTREEPFDCIQLIQQMEYGIAIKIDQMIADVVAGQQISMLDGKYIGTVGASRTVLRKIYNWLWSWEPAMGGRAVGGGEMAMILNHPDGQKGEGQTGGDVVIKGKYKIEMKKASASDSGAAFGSSNNFRQAWQYFSTFCENAGVPEDEITTEIGFGTKMGTTQGSQKPQKFAAAMNQASALLSGSGISDNDINKMWDNICQICIGVNTYKQDCITNGMTDINKFMHTWCANGIDAYATKSRHDLLFFFEPSTLAAVAVTDGRNFLGIMGGNNGPLTYDWDISWTQMGYGNYVPRFKVDTYREIRSSLNIRDIKEKARLLPIVKEIVKYTSLKEPGGDAASINALMPYTGVRGVPRQKGQARIDAQVKMIQGIRKFYTLELERVSTDIISRDQKEAVRKGLQKFEELQLWLN